MANITFKFETPDFNPNVRWSPRHCLKYMIDTSEYNFKASNIIRKKFVLVATDALNEIGENKVDWVLDPYSYRVWFKDYNNAIWFKLRFEGNFNFD